MRDFNELDPNGRLSHEWQNCDAPDFMHGDRLVSMSRLKARVLEIQRTEPYARTWASLVLGEHERHAHNDEYVARILVLLDHRPIPINPLQRSIGFQLGHLFRTLNERAGVEFRAHTSTMRARIRQDYYSWPHQVFVDAENHRILHGDQVIAIPPELQVFKKDAKRPMKHAEDELPDDEDLDPDALDAFEVEDELIGLLPDDSGVVVPPPLHWRMRNPAGPPVYRPVTKRG